MSTRKRTAAAVAFAYAYAWPYCTGSFIFCTNKHEHKQQSADLSCQKKLGYIMHGWLQYEQDSPFVT
jgi:hypothetical protein